jgi:hypothetical protein
MRQTLKSIDEPALPGGLPVRPLSRSAVKRVPSSWPQYGSAAESPTRSNNGFCDDEFVILLRQQGSAARPSPIFRACHQPCSHRIKAHLPGRNDPTAFAITTEAGLNFAPPR